MMWLMNKHFKTSFVFQFMDTWLDSHLNFVIAALLEYAIVHHFNNKHKMHQEAKQREKANDDEQDTSAEDNGREKEVRRVRRIHGLRRIFHLTIVCQNLITVPMKIEDKKQTNKQTNKSSFNKLNLPSP